MEIKAIITDLDRTLLHTDKTLSVYTISTLHRCRENGIFVMAATARPYRSIEDYDNVIGFDGAVTMNGAVIIMPQGKVEFSIKKESAERIAAAISEFPDVFLSFETDRGLYSNRDIPEWSPTVIESFSDIPDDAKIYKILASSGEPQLYENIGQILTCDVYHTIAAGKLIQIMSGDATKWKGVCYMLDALGVSARNAVFFGDDNDDVEPIKNCGLGVAVSNALPVVIDSADAVADCNDDDGVARFIDEKIIRGNL